MGDILILDNYDSFTFNLVHSVQKFTSEKVVIIRNDKVRIEEIDEFDRIILSPGPGIPKDAGILKEIIRVYAPTKTILGVCLGMQAIAEVFGASLFNMKSVYHGVATPVNILDVSEILFRKLPPHFNAGRYHSWLVSKNNLPECLKITCEDTNGNIMAISHKNYDIKGVQFHPESILTEYGDTIISNWLHNHNT